MDEARERNRIAMQRVIDEAQQLKAIFDSTSVITDHIKDHANQFEEQAKDQINTLTAEHDRLIGSISHIRTSAEGSSNRAAELKQTIESQLQKIGGLQQKVSQEEVVAKATRGEVDVLLKELEQKEAEWRSKLEVHQSTLEMYRVALGLDIQKSADGIQLVFTQINRLRPEEPYVLGVNIVNGNQYTVTRCDPPLGDVLPPFLQGLNSTNNFGTFVKNVRAEFKRLAAALTT